MATNGKRRSSVPQFGAWDGASQTNYTVVFSNVRADKKEKKQSTDRHSLDGGESVKQKKRSRDDSRRQPFPPRKSRMEEEIREEKRMRKCYGWLCRA